MPRDAVQQTELPLSPYAHDACEAFVLGSGRMAVCGTMRAWETYEQDSVPCAPRQVGAATVAEGDISSLPSTSAAVLHPNTRKRARRERSPELDMLARRMRSATGKRKTTGETMHDASPSDDLPGQMLPPPHSELPEVNLTPGPRTPYPRKTNLQVDLSCLTAFDGGPVSPGEEGGSQFVPSPTAMPSTCSSDAERVATPTSVSSAAPPVYPIFKAQTKTVYLIRHGESEYNAADAYYSKSFEEPFIFDAPLTYKGTMQARGLGPALRALPVNDIVWVTSPLTRAMQTCLLAMEASGRMPLAAADGGARAASCAPSAGTAQTQSGGEVRVGPITRQHTREQRPGATVHVLKDLAEHLATSGDVGRPRSTLQAAVPALATQLAALPHEEWWWAPAKNDHVTQRFGSREPKGAFRKRVGEFRQWVLSRPESNIVVFGHSTFFKELQGGHARRLANCELMKIRI